MVVYLIGSLRNPEVPRLANAIRAHGLEVFDDWYAAGPEADDKWRDYEKLRGHSLAQALEGHAANHVWRYDRHHLDRADVGVLVLPTGKSGHLELGYIIGRGKPGYIYYAAGEPEPERWDVMYRFAKGVYFDKDQLINTILMESI